MFSLFFTSCGEQGCTDPTAFNYNPDVKYDDGNCIYCQCGDVQAVNYIPNAPCIRADSCKYNSDHLIGSYNGVANVRYSGDTTSSDSLFDITIEIGQADWNKNVPWVEENDVRYDPDTLCIEAYIEITDSSYHVQFASLSSDIPASCLERLPYSFNFQLEADTLIYTGVSLFSTLDTSGTGRVREINFKGVRTE